MKFLPALAFFLLGPALCQSKQVTCVAAPAPKKDPSDSGRFESFVLSGLMAKCGGQSLQVTYLDGNLRIITTPDAFKAIVRVNGRGSGGSVLGDSKTFWIDPNADCAIPEPNITPESISCFNIV
ncbi:hypothetical protein C8035_v007536 [Colletotrichum spinosum]|uniref:Uncharacterized protein n=1 Tax=Colletotrichum spinosum TaxID=1347390 RepID=A0A4R8Q4B4_9PEZI|nr:hypothetical protein C8035_v007536 [Colletotrichum spinosum]